MLLDEPTPTLDPELVGEVLDALRGPGRAGVVLDGGLLVERGIPADVPDKPQHERTRAFLSEVLI